jgi:hypothetical protein
MWLNCPIVASLLHSKYMRDLLLIQGSPTILTSNQQLHTSQDQVQPQTELQKQEAH